jgi:hypothetical protein
VFERLDAPPALSPEERQLLDSVRALDLPLPEGLKIEADLSTWRSRPPIRSRA